ncbi:MAG TPA: hypothetical protein GXX30_10780 [Firmicutes bacterium]|nr:hypothetical protein [Candidatus Fermentithermobacillaceae bacterium]
MAANLSEELTKYFPAEVTRTLVTLIEQTVDKRFEQLKKTEIDHHCVPSLSAKRFLL